MNTNPDEITLALWLDDELTGAELAKVEAWAAEHPEQFEARARIREWRAHLSSAMPANEEPPYPDFFNSRVLQAIQSAPAVTAKSNGSFWRSWFIPAAACAGMVMAFPTPRKNVTPRSKPIEM